MTQGEELRNCPFCGNSDIRYDGSFLYCKTGGKCGCQLHEKMYEELSGLEKRWNSAFAWKELDRLKELIKIKDEAMKEANRVIRKYGDDGWKFGQKALELIEQALKSGEK